MSNPVAELAPDGTLRLTGRCAHPDSLPGTEFHAGLLVAGFPHDYRACFERLRAATRPLPELLPGVVREGGIAVVLSGLDYATLRLTPRSVIRRL